MTTSHSV